MSKPLYCRIFLLFLFKNNHFSIKNFILLFVFFWSVQFFAQEKKYFTEHFTEIPYADNAIYYTIYQSSSEGTLRTTYYLDNSLYTKDHFSNYKKKNLKRNI